jgi:hypothetical protein
MSQAQKMSTAQVQLLFDYTKFHIGLYTALITLLLLLAKEANGSLSPKMICCLSFTVACFLLAGICGGIIASTISLNSSAIEDDNEIGPWGLKPLRARTWAHLEHAAFWIGVFITLLGLTLRW